MSHRRFAVLRFHKHTFCLCDRHRMLGHGRPSKRRIHSSAGELRCHCRAQPYTSKRQRGNVADDHLQPPAEAPLRCSCCGHIPTLRGCSRSHSSSCSYGHSYTCSKYQCCSHSHGHSHRCCSNGCSYSRSLGHVRTYCRRSKGHPEPGLVRQEQKQHHRHQQLQVMQMEASSDAAQKWWQLHPCAQPQPQQPCQRHWQGW
jgi:hypothetical protein